MPEKIEYKRFRLPLPKNYFMSLLSGVESGLATTTAIVAGLTLTTENRHVVIATAMISLSVQAWNSALITISAQHTENQIEHPYSIREHYIIFISSGAAQFLAHIIASIIPILPMVLISDLGVALDISVVVTLLILFLFGYNKARIIKRRPIKGGLEDLITGALVIAVGVIAGFALG